MDNTLGDRLEKIKKNERLSIEEYMELLGVTKTSYYNWKNGENYPNSDILIRIIDKYPKYSADWLLIGRGEMYWKKSTQEVNDFEEHYGIENLKNKVENLTKEVQNLKDRLEPKEEIIRHQGEMLAKKTFGLSPQKRYKKGE